jgi:hypothetical protein
MVGLRRLWDSSTVPQDAARLLSSERLIALLGHDQINGTTRLAQHLQ